jgi:hypothetical protein
MGEHGDRMPIARDLAMPGPLETFGGQTGLNMRVGRDEIGVIVIDELETRHRAKDRDSHQCQRDGDPK